ncbi:SWIM zinc finger family protein [Halobellus limi]|uniref:SWIM zinc finger n=1 Tax=Halobellus limi TaxID=699433 RepID=A0A1H5WHU9_9EURY|nr:SWIM zinc finger family protein [Halobellus limi]SEF98886.1 SWIM zinc finger [Halobellus limi]
MTHIRNPPASGKAAVSSDTAPDRSRDARPADGTASGDRRGSTATDGRGRTFPADGYDGRAYRARAEPMVVRPLRDGRYVVESDGGTYVVAAERTTCTCPDSAIRGARCKHIRRVSLEIEAGNVPGPNERERVCAVCGGRTFGPIDDGGPALCARHEHAPGDLVRDRETGTLLAVVEAVGERADETPTDEGRLVSEYETNAAYGGQEPVFAAVYVESLPADADGGRRYLFPASRLQHLDESRAPEKRRGCGERGIGDGGESGVKDGDESGVGNDGIGSHRDAAADTPPLLDAVVDVTDVGQP